MDRLATPAKSHGRRRAVRTGRPPRKLAGEVDTRILDAARHIFLERGLAGASVDEISRLARAGKPTIYARFPNKEALFTAVVMQSIAANIARFEAHTPIGATLEKRLESMAVNVLRWILVSNPIDAHRDCRGVSVSRFGQQCLRDGTRARRATRGPAFDRGGTIRRARRATGARSRARRNNDAILPGFSAFSLDSASVVWRKA